MPWTTPRTWATSEVVTAAMLNSNVRDNSNWLNSHHGCYIYKTALQTVPNGNDNVLSFNSETYDSDGFHDNVTNNSRITIPAGLGGYYYVAVTASSDADATNHTQANLRLRQNAAAVNSAGTLLTIARGIGHTVAWMLPTLVWQGNLVAGDHIEVFFQSFSEAHDVTGGVSETSMQAIYLGT